MNKEIDMTRSRIAGLLLATAFAFTPQAAFAQAGAGQEQHVPLQKTSDKASLRSCRRCS